MASLNIVQVTGYSAFKPSVLTFPFKTRRAVYLSSAPIRTNFSAYKHFGSPSRVNSVKAKQSQAETIRSCASAVASYKRSL